MAIKMTDAQIERTQVEQVFGLTGGELNDSPWGGFAYNYEGVPEWASEDFDRETRASGEYVTVIEIGCSYGSSAAETLEVDGQTLKNS